MNGAKSLTEKNFCRDPSNSKRASLWIIFSDKYVRICFY